GLRHGRRPSRPPAALPAAARSRPVGQPCPAAEARRDGGDGRGPDPAARRRLQRPAPGPLPRSQPLAEDRHRTARRRRQLRGLTPMTSPTTSPRRARTARHKLDAITAEAIQLAREALLAVTEPGLVCGHIRGEAVGDRVVSHVFDCAMPGDRVRSWVAALARASRVKAAAVAETALLPGEDAILARGWEPWSERLKPLDVSA